MENAEQSSLPIEETIAEVASILARGYLRYIQRREVNPTDDTQSHQNT